ncbi:GIY-YIG nuclease family protein [Nodosilinea sp. AN01ver1]|uniref:GIY-YIG nuclease family protein n=1 Tax=Nodosilinea sp. AN01ver1 TaxID=3423362 RepID=UPI003D320B20
MKRFQKRRVEETIPLNDFGFNLVHNGIYCLFCEDDKTYVGQSKCIEIRYQEHGIKRPTKAFILEHIDPYSILYRNVISSDKVMDTCEALWIAILEPDLNIQLPKLKIDSYGKISGYCVTPGKSYEKPSQNKMRQIAAALGWSLEKQDKWMGQLCLG